MHDAVHAAGIVFHMPPAIMSSRHSVYVLCDYALQVQKIFQDWVVKFNDHLTQEEIKAARIQKKIEESKKKPKRKAGGNTGSGGNLPGDESEDEEDEWPVKFLPDSGKEVSSVGIRQKNKHGDKNFAG